MDQSNPSPFSRRRFLQTAAVGTVVGTLGGALATQLPATPLVAATPRSTTTAPPAITFGFSLYGMRSLSLEAALKATAEIGYDAVELAVMPDWPADPHKLSKDDRKRLREQLARHNLKLPALMENTPLDVDEKTHRQQLDRLKAAAELGHDLSPDAPPLIETILGGKPGQWENLRPSTRLRTSSQFADRLAEWAKLGEQSQTVIAIKAHRFGAMNAPEHAVWLVEKVDSKWIKLVYDFSHFSHREMEIADTLKTMLPHTRFIHVKDTRIENGQAKFLLPGDGQTDYVELLKQVHAARYTGCVCVEVSGMLQNQKDYDPIAAARRSYQNLAPAFEKAGIRRK